MPWNINMNRWERWENHFEDELRWINDEAFNEFLKLYKNVSIINLLDFLDSKGIVAEIYTRNQLLNGKKVFSHYLRGFGRNGQYTLKAPRKNQRDSCATRIRQCKLAIMDGFLLLRKISTPHNTPHPAPVVPDLSEQA